MRVRAEIVKMLFRLSLVLWLKRKNIGVIFYLN